MSKIVNVWYKLRIPNLPDFDSSTGVQEKSVLSRLINGVYDLFLDEFVPLKIVAEHLNVYLSVEDATSPDNKLPMDTPIKDIINRVSAQKPLIIIHQLPHDQQQQQATALALMCLLTSLVVGRYPIPIVLSRQWIYIDSVRNTWLILMTHPQRFTPLMYSFIRALVWVSHD